MNNEADRDRFAPMRTYVKLATARETHVKEQERIDAELDWGAGREIEDAYLDARDEHDSVWGNATFTSEVVSLLESADAIADRSGNVVWRKRLSTLIEIAAALRLTVVARAGTTTETDSER